MSSILRFPKAAPDLPLIDKLLDAEARLNALEAKIRHVSTTRQSFTEYRASFGNQFDQQFAQIFAKL